MRREQWTKDRGGNHNGRMHYRVGKLMRDTPKATRFTSSRVLIGCNNGMIHRFNQNMTNLVRQYSITSNPVLLIIRLGITYICIRL